MKRCRFLYAGVYCINQLFLFFCFVLQSTFAVNCPKGSYISSRGCTPCPENEYSDYVNSTKCWKCDACKGRHNLVTQVCNSTTNTKCACEPGFYWDDALFCLKCDRCKRGHGMVKNCTSDSNTVCEHCEHVRRESYYSFCVFVGGSVVERLGRWTCNPEAASSSPALAGKGICPR